MQKRRDWLTRQSDSIFQKLAPEYRPQNPPLPPHDTAAAEEVLLLCQREDGRVCNKGLGGDQVPGGVSLLPVPVKRVVEEKLVLSWQILFEAKGI